MSLRIPLSPDQTLQTEFHEIERRLRRLEKRTGVSAGSTTIQVLGGGVGVTNLQPLITRIEALEAVVAAIPDPDDFDIDVFGAVGPSSATGIVPEPGVAVPPTGVAQHLLTEDAEWGFPLRGLVSVATSGEQTVPPHDVVDVAAGLHVAGPIVAPTIDGGNYVSPVIVGDDGYIHSDASGALAQRNGATSQTFRIYNTYTDATNWERFSLGWTSNVTRITTEQQGSGTSRVLRLGSTGTASMYLMSNNVDKWVLDQYGQLYPGTDASYPIGTSSVRVRGIFLGGGAGYVPITAKLHASQTANALEIQNSSGTALAKVDKDGKIYTGSVFWASGTGDPEGVVTAPVGSLFSRTDGGAATSLYVKETGTGNTGWVGK